MKKFYSAVIVMAIAVGLVTGTGFSAGAGSEKDGPGLYEHSVTGAVKYFKSHPGEPSQWRYIGESSDSVNAVQAVTGGDFIARGGDIVITCLQKDAWLKSKLYVTVNGEFDKYLFRSSETGAIHTIKARFVPEGASVEFRLVVENGDIFYSGPADSNLDGVVHVQAHQQEDGSWNFGFEDLYGGGDLDFNDCNFNVAGVTMLGGLEVKSTAKDQILESDRFEYIPVKTKLLQWHTNGSIQSYRIIAEANTIDHNLFHAGTIDVELDIWNVRDGEWMTIIGSNEIAAFDLTKTKSRYGYRLEDYNYPEYGSYVGKCRLENVKGMGTHYLYFHQIGSGFEYLNQNGNQVEYRIRLYQDGELIQAYISDFQQSQLIK